MSDKKYIIYAWSKKKGKKNIRRFKVRIELIEPGKDDEIAVIENTHGGRPPRFSCRTINDDLINAPIQGSIAKGPRRVLVKKGDFVLLSKWSVVRVIRITFIMYIQK